METNSPNPGHFGTRNKVLPQPILHARDGMLTAGSAGRKRSAAVLLVAITVGVGATTYSALSAGRNCGQDNANRDQSANCGQTNNGGHGWRRSFFGNMNFGTAAPDEHSTATRGGFGKLGLAHMSWGG